jgi:hypothetical protein
MTADTTESRNADLRRDLGRGGRVLFSLSVARGGAKKTKTRCCPQTQFVQRRLRQTMNRDEDNLNVERHLFSSAFSRTLSHYQFNSETESTFPTLHIYTYLYAYRW